MTRVADRASWPFASAVMIWRADPLQSRAPRISVMIALFATLGHVPTYTNDACVNNCCVPGSLNVNLSQVLYLKGTGGLEIPLANADAALHPDRAEPLPTGKPFPIYFDVVLKEPLEDFSMIEVYAGCGGCVAGDALVPASKRTNFELQPASLEPFTQTLYHSIYPPDNILEPDFRSFPSSELLAPGCDHVTVRLIDHNTSRTLVWGAVLGRAEAFTIGELVSFPSYVIQNHADWNDASYTLPLSALFAILIILAWKLQCCGVRRWCCGAQKKVPKWDVCACSNVAWPVVWWAKWISKDRRVLWREALYAIAQFSFVWFGLEMVWHLYIATGGTDVSIAPGLWLVVFSQLLPLWLTIILWRGIEYRARLSREWESENCSLSCGACGGCGGLSWLFCRGCVKGAKKAGAKPSGIYTSNCWMALTSPSFALLEIFTGLSLYVWFAAGVYVGPTCIVLAGVLRASDICRDPPLDDRLSDDLKNALDAEAKRTAKVAPVPIATPMPGTAASAEGAPLLQAWTISLK